MVICTWQVPFQPNPAVFPFIISYFSGARIISSRHILADLRTFSAVIERTKVPEEN